MALEEVEESLPRLSRRNREARLTPTRLELHNNRAHLTATHHSPLTPTQRTTARPETSRVCNHRDRECLRRLRDLSNSKEVSEGIHRGMEEDTDRTLPPTRPRSPSSPPLSSQVPSARLWSTTHTVSLCLSRSSPTCATPQTDSWWWGQTVGWCHFKLNSNRNSPHQARHLSNLPLPDRVHPLSLPRPAASARQTMMRTSL